MKTELIDSKIEWIGMIPSDWKIERLQWHLEEVNKKNDPIKTTNILSLTNKLGVVPYNEKGNQGNNSKDNYEEYKLAYENTIVANSMNILIGSVGISKYYGCVSPVYYVFRAKDNENIEYFNYLFQTKEFQKELRKYANGILEIRLRVSSDDILKRYVPIPSYKEQSLIVKTLDGKCTTINKIIKNLETEIERLEDYKKAVITKAVTKGLDTNVKMKDSGIEWIGEIPNYWQLIRIKHILDKSEFGIKCGPFGSALTGKIIDNGDFYVYGQWNVVDNDFAIRRNTINEISFNDLTNYQVKPKDILVSMMGTIGRCTIVPDNIPKGIMDSHIIKIRINSDLISSKFFMFEYDKTYSNIICEYFTRQKKGFIMDGLNTSIIKNALFVLPPKKEQDNIVFFVEGFLNKVNRLLDLKNKRMCLMKDYKKSLIYEYVTGKNEGDYSICQKI